MPMKNTCAVLLTSAGETTRPGRTTVLSQVLFRSLVRWVYDNCQGAGIEKIRVVTGTNREEISRELPKGAVAAGEENDRDTDGMSWAKILPEEYRDTDVLIAAGDAPFLCPEALAASLALHREQGNEVTAIVGAACPGKGKNLPALWVRGAALSAIPEGLSIGETLEALRGTAGKTGEFALDTVEAGMRVETLRQLRDANHIARDNVLDRLCDAGVEIPITDGVMIDPRARIGAGAQILPGTVIKGETTVGAGSVIGPNSWLENAAVGGDCVLSATYILEAVLDDDVQIGPFCRVRPGSHISAGVRIGNFVEVKNANVGPGTKSAHLTYIGDADVGARVNFGCGVCIANYDGVHKHRTVIGDDCFIGCNTNLVAPVTLGDGAYTAAGSTVTQDVPEDALCIARSRQTNLPQRAKEHQKHPRK